MAIQRSQTSSLVIGLLLIGIGILSMFDRIFQGWHLWATFWPFILAGVGGLCFLGMGLGGKPAAWLAIPGSMIIVNAMLVFFQNLTGDWALWSSGWTLTLASLGLGIFIMGAYQENEHRRQAGLKVMKVAGVLFLIFGLFFGVLFSPNGLFGQRFAIPIFMIVLGAYLLIVRVGWFGSKKMTDESRAEIS